MFRVWSIGEGRQIRQKGSMKGIKQTHGQTINCREQLNSPLNVSDGWFFVRRDEESIDNQVSPMTRQQHSRDRQTGRRFPFVSPKGKRGRRNPNGLSILTTCFPSLLPIRQTYCSCIPWESEYTPWHSQESESDSRVLLHHHSLLDSLFGRDKKTNMTWFLFFPLPSNGELVSIYPKNLEKKGKWMSSKNVRGEVCLTAKSKFSKIFTLFLASSWFSSFLPQEISSRHVVNHWIIPLFSFPVKKLRVVYAFEFSVFRRLRVHEENGGNFNEKSKVNEKLRMKMKKIDAKCTDTQSSLLYCHLSIFTASSMLRLIFSQSEFNSQDLKVICANGYDSAFVA